LSWQSALGKDAPNLSPAVITRLADGIRRRAEARSLGTSQLAVEALIISVTPDAA
jgi:hypothetical protein